MTTNHTKLLTPTEVSEKLGVKLATLAAWRHHQRYQLPYVKIGSRVAYKAGDVEEFIEANLHSADVVEVAR